MLNGNCQTFHLKHFAYFWGGRGVLGSYGNKLLYLTFFVEQIFQGKTWQKCLTVSGQPGLFVVNRNITNIQSNFLKEGFLLSCENHNITGDLCNCLTIQFNYSTDIQKIPLEKNGMKVSSAFGSTAFVSSLSSRQSPWQSPCSTLYNTLCEKHNLDTTYFLSQLP